MINQETSMSLLLRIREQDDEADWQRFIDLYKPLVLGWGKRFDLRDADLDDLFQETLTIVRRRIDSFSKDAPGQSFRKWLYVVVRNKTMDFHRQKGQQPQAHGGTTVLQALQQIPEDEPEEWSVAEMSDHALLARALKLVEAEFEPRTWKAFWLSKVEDLSTETIAEQLVMSKGAVRKARFRVLHRLRNELDGLMNELLDA